MELETLLKHCSSIAKIAFKSSKSVSEIASNFFNQKKYIGSKERKIISEILFIHLRFLAFSNYLAEKFFPNKPKQLENEIHPILLSLFINIVLYPESLKNLTQNIENFYRIPSGKTMLQDFIAHILNNLYVGNKNLLEELQGEIDKINNETKYWEGEIEKFSREKTQSTNSTDFLKPLAIAAIRYSIPEFILHSWFDYYIPKQINIFELAESLLYPAHINIRVNNLQIKQTEILQTLQSNGISCKKTRYSPLGIIIQDRIDFGQLEQYRKGLVEIQDEGSQLVCFAINPQPKDRILDACAGAGGKSLLLALLQQDKGEIVANDINFLKLKELQLRAKRSNFNSITINHFQPKKKNGNLLKPFDIVLVDAPCSGLGTARRMPMQKWRLTLEKLDRYAQKQIELLNYYSRFLRKGGILVYSTCSLMPQENEKVIQAFIEQNPNFRPEPLAPALKSFKIQLETLGAKDFSLTLFPSIHKTDGFFIAKLKKAT